ncbi:50S ribosomal protein L4 [bacterium]|nr:50S ribosomal protein L4 [bacterium]MBU1024856.1 50S ribosomal protein L4 [bacterium]
MAIVKFYDIKGKVKSEQEVPLSFQLKPNDPELLAKSVRRQLANARRSWASTKTRGEIRGGGSKPWRQKGTGRARHGSSRSPIWTGGGVTFGPIKTRSYKEKMNKKERRRAMQVGLMMKILDESFYVIEGISLDKPSTKDSKKILENLPLNGGKTLLLASRDDDRVFLGFRNISKIECLHADRINGFSLLNNDSVLATSKAYELIKEVWLS